MLLCEPVARRANREDRCTGRFFEGRFKSQALLDEAAVLACSIYVDLNPIRARIAETPETSKYTGAFERILARQAADVPSAPSDAVAAEWLSPVPDSDSRTLQADSFATVPLARASNRGFLPMTLEEYLCLLDWTGRQIRSDKRGAVPADLRPILERLAINAEMWLDTIGSFGRWFHRAVGRVSSMEARANRSGRHWFQGASFSRLAFE